MSDRRITDGARDLRAYLTEHSISVPDFCEEHGLDRIQVQRVLNGDRWKRITVDFAHAIDRATGGSVPWTTWRSTTAVDPADPDAGPQKTESGPIAVADIVSDDTDSTGTDGS